MINVLKLIIDISSWQEEVDWEQAANEFDGVILKIGEGGHGLDEMFIDHVNNAVKYNIPYGIYYFSHAANITDAYNEADEIDYFITDLLDGKEPELGIWYDCESDDMGEPTYTITSFIDYMRSKGYTNVGVYTSYNWLAYGRIDLSYMYDVPIWVAQYNSQNDLAQEHPELDIQGWQYTDNYSDEFPYDASIFYK